MPAEDRGVRYVIAQTQSSMETAKRWSPTSDFDLSALPAAVGRRWWQARPGPGAAAFQEECYRRLTGTRTGALTGRACYRMFSVRPQERRSWDSPVVGQPWLYSVVSVAVIHENESKTPVNVPQFDCGFLMRVQRESYIAFLATRGKAFPPLRVHSNHDALHPSPLAFPNRARYCEDAPVSFWQCLCTFLARRSAFQRHVERGSQPICDGPAAARALLYKNELCSTLGHLYDPVTTIVCAARPPGFFFGLFADVRVAYPQMPSSDPPSPTRLQRPTTQRAQSTPVRSSPPTPAEAIAQAWQSESPEAQQRWRRADSLARERYLNPFRWNTAGKSQERKPKGKL
ncbi:hypothetical protein C8Q78DRAFT_995237 [Trametes maxima]|nr:hypothetical protein C8Q78DRAFT_995237 [Trametes maxima]